MSWSITITANDATTHEPALYTPRGESFPKRIPAANGRPKLKIAVPPERDSNGDPKWFESRFEEADVSVSLDGTTQPYDTLVGYEDRPRDGVVVLTIEGGDVLDQRVDESFDVLPTHDAASQVVTNNTSLNTDIPTPSTTRTDNVLVKSVSSGGFSTADFEKIPEDSPVHINGSGYLTAHQTNYVSTSTSALSGHADGFTVSFTVNYSIPADRIGAAILTDVDTNHVGVELAVDGEVIGQIRPGATFSSSPKWVQVTGGTSRLAPGSHDLRVSVTTAETPAGPTNGLTPDAVALFDSKWQGEYAFGTADTTPDLYPNIVRAYFRPPAVTRSVRGITITPTWAGGNAGQWSLSNGGTRFGGTDTDFSSHGAVVDVIVALEQYNDGQNITELQAVDIEADLETMPLVVNERVEGTVGEVLTELADTLRGDFIWTYDTDSNGNPTIRFVRSGSRTTTQSDIEDYSLSKTVADRLEEVRVIGGRPATSEEVRVDLDTTVDLVKDRLVEDSETVRAPDFDQPLQRGSHYSIDYANGTITFDSNPAQVDPVDDGVVATVSYQFQPAATTTASGATSPKRTAVIDELPLRSDGACRLAAKQILNAANSPTYDATADVRGNTTYSVVTELVAGRLPVSNLGTVDITATPAGASVRLEARRSVGGVVSDVRERIESVARHSR